jgi:pyruvate/2-oxoglutarate dehydrogenase complex dihydrolipoamide acyltransferase (E2) component
MATEVKIPALGESISSGILAQWHVKSGDYVESGQALFDLETDKITSEATAESSGVITCLAEEGDEVEIGAVVATIEPAEKPAETASPADSTAAPAKAPPPPPRKLPQSRPPPRGSTRRP